MTDPTGLGIGALDQYADDYVRLGASSPLAALIVLRGVPEMLGDVQFLGAHIDALTGFHSSISP